MMDDELSRVVQAFREENTASALDRAAIRRRVLSAYQRKAKRRPLFTWFLPAAVLLLGSAALAAHGTTRPGLARVRAWLDRGVSSSVRAKAPDHDQSARTVPAIGPAPTAHAPSAYPPGEPLRSDGPPAVAVIADATSAIAATSNRSQRSAVFPRPRTLAFASREAAARNASSASPREPDEAEQPASPPPAPDGKSEQDADLLLYRVAHRRHFQDRDPKRALAAWDTYLAAFPKGRLAVEARFNRALCLIKVGRIAQAEASLQEIASGIFGTYRSARAAELLDAIQRRRASAAK
jgi:hypothetical protein